jgi:hypothetical protein
LIKSVSPGPASIVGLSTIVVYSPLPSSSSSSNESNETKVFNKELSSSSVSTTAVVEDLIRRSILPSVLLPSAISHFKGFLLLGPPGVGKTFAVKAVQQICEPYFNLTIEELNIPDILSDEDPIQKLKDIFKKINQRNKFSLNNNTNNNNNNSSSPISKSGVASFLSPARAGHGGANPTVNTPHSPINIAYSPIKNKDNNNNNNNNMSVNITFLIIDEVDALGILDTISLSLSLSTSSNTIYCCRFA